MSSVPPAAQPVSHPPPVNDADREITIVSHSNLFYWWPVWAVAFLMAVLTWFDGYVVAVVPAENSHSIPVAKTDWELKNGDKREGVLIEPKPGKAPDKLPRAGDDQPQQPHLRVAGSKGYGVFFAFVLLMVIVITNIPLRGMWSLLVIMAAVMLILIFSLANLWGPLVEMFSQLDVRMTMGFYMLVAGVLFVVWLFTFVFFDRQVYMRFTPGQLKVCTEVGGGEHVYDAIGMTMEKQRSDLFRHWILGLGSGDLVVRTAGAQAHQFDLPNVLFIGRKVQMIEDMLKKKSVIDTK